MSSKMSTARAETRTSRGPREPKDTDVLWLSKPTAFSLRVADDWLQVPTWFRLEGSCGSCGSCGSWLLESSHTGGAVEYHISSTISQNFISLAKIWNDCCVWLTLNSPKTACCSAELCLCTLLNWQIFLPLGSFPRRSGHVGAWILPRA